MSFGVLRACRGSYMPHFVVSSCSLLIHGMYFQFSFTQFAASVHLNETFCVTLGSEPVICPLTLLARLHPCGQVCRGLTGEC